MLGVTTCVAQSATTAPTTRPTTSVTQPTPHNLQVVEWAVFVVDASANQMNPQGYVTSTLPGFVTDHRFNFGPITPVVPSNPNGNMFFNGRFWMQINVPPANADDSKPKLADSDQPSPVGVIRLIGSADSKVDVSISSKDGSFLGSWPKAEERDKQLLWRDLSIAAKPSDDPQLVATTHWFNALRSVGSAYLSLAHGGADRFLLYDLEQPYTSPLKIKSAGDFKFEVANQTGLPLHDLTLYQGDHDAWRSIRIGEMAASAHPATTAPAAPKAASVKDRLGVTVSDVSADPSRAANFGYRRGLGLFVDEVVDGGPAAGKLNASDIIVNVDGKAVKSAAEFVSQLTGTSASLRVYRANRYSMVNITLAGGAAPVPTTGPAVAVTRSATQPVTGVRLGINLSEVKYFRDTAKSFGYNGTEGLIVQRIEPNSLADGHLQEGDIILALNGQDVSTAADFKSRLNGSSAKMRVFRSNNTIDVEITLGMPATQPVAAATTKPTTEPAGKAYQLTNAATTQPSDLADTWKPIITAAGIDPADAATMTRIISRYAFDPHRLTAVYRMDNAEMDRMLPIEVVPQPAKISRFALVIVINADPGAGTIVDDLIKQLGDEDWARRDAAYNALAGMGPAAQAKLTTAKNNTDLEIAWRAERLLALLPGAAK